MPLFKVAAVPSDTHTETNCVYVNPADATGAGPFVDVKGFPFTVQSDERVALGSLAMNSLQRRCTSVTTTTNDVVEVPTGGLKVPNALLASATVELEYIAASKKGGTLDVEEFKEWFLGKFTGQYFRDGQLIAAIFDSPSQGSVMKLSARLSKVITASADGPGKDATIGRLTPESQLSIKATEKSEIQLTNVPDTEAPQLMQTFDLESIGIGGLSKEFNTVFRRAFASRIFPKSFTKLLGPDFKHAKGVLLYGPPGTGKTLIARKIGEILNCRPPKIVNGPEVFNKYVGGTEENIRKLFAEAEAEQAAKGDQSQLHLIIFDEFDAICKQRGATRDGTGVNDNVVNQLLSKIDGVNSLNNVLLIGMTNRKDMIDEAILRSGRFEVHVEIGLPDEEGRLEIFRIHTKYIRENNVMAPDVDLAELARVTKNFSGAEIAGVVRTAISSAMSRHVDYQHPTETIQASEVKVTMEDFMHAVEETPIAFGKAKDQCDSITKSGIINYGPVWGVISRKCNNFVEHLRGNSKIDALSVLVEGPVGCGKSSVAAHLALLAEFPFVKLISSNNLVGFGEYQKANIIQKAFDDAYKSNTSVIVLDDLERLIEYSNLGGRYSNLLLQTLLVLIKRPPPEGKRVLVIGTTSQYDVMDSLELAGCFSANLQIPTLDSTSLVPIVQGVQAKFKSPDEQRQCMDALPSQMCIKKLLLIVEMAASGSDRVITYDSFQDAILSTGTR
eukprot:CAMPEP_0176446602 /NCGR_PEP_ID=MMETSP0127-20121128/24428_1 /TAXON_ID=938130 /ORGANISM="Platyophrya macrostoma, Strain WH" /LENGTH=727 /DNA_ID=CAMNT_0017832677 /DNA_START=82 /DNA_END=2265 /DNA_ORIENTATION=+